MWLYALILFTCSGISSNQAAKWSYTGDTGTTFWHEIFPEACSGKHQSPIDIRHEETIYNSDLRDFAIWYDPPKPDSKMYIKNNGHTVQVDLEGEFYVTNGGLSNVYRALQFHFHWGNADHHGSEHLLDGTAFPLEMHLVTYNQEKFTDIGEAVVTKGGLAVLGTVYEISEEDNPELEVIMKALKHIRDPEIHEKVALPLMSLRKLLPKDISRYYRYDGSLTTPGCFESVTWSVFQDRQTISLAQLKEFTKVMHFKHFHKKGKHGLKKHHRRSLSRHRRDLERNAQDVLYELGIKGNHFEEAVLKSELLNQHMMADSPQDSKAVDENEQDEEENKKQADNEEVSTHDEKNNKDGSEGDEPVVVHSRQNEDDGANNEEGSKGTHNGNNHENHQENHAHAHSTEDKIVEEDAEEDEYTQDVMVNNFRPVQPLNDRTVYRSFETSPSATIDDGYQIESYKPSKTATVDDDYQVETYKPAKSVNFDYNDNGDNAAGHHTLSLLSVLSTLMLVSIFI